VARSRRFPSNVCGTGTGASSQHRPLPMPNRPSSIDVTELLLGWGSGSQMKKSASPVRGGAVGVPPDCRGLHATRARQSQSATYRIGQRSLLADRRRPYRVGGRAHFFGIAATSSSSSTMRGSCGEPSVRRGAVDQYRNSPIPQVVLTSTFLHCTKHSMISLGWISARTISCSLGIAPASAESDVATVKGLSPATVRRDLASARLWLGRRLRGR